MPTPHKTGRHRRFSDKQIGDALRANGGVQVLAARALEQASGIPCSRQLVNLAVMRSKALRKICFETIEATLDIAEAQAIAKINEGSEYSVWRYLETKGKARGYTRRVENTGADGGPIQQVVIPVDPQKLAAMSEDELSRLYRETIDAIGGNRE